MFPLGTSPDIVLSVKASDTREVMAIGSLVLKETGNNIQPLTSSFSYKASTTTNLVSVKKRKQKMCPECKRISREYVLLCFE